MASPVTCEGRTRRPPYRVRAPTIILGAAGAWWPIPSTKRAGRGSPPLGRFDSFAASLSPDQAAGAGRQVARKGFDERLGDQASAHDVPGGCVVDAVRDEPTRLGVCRPVENAHRRISDA